MARGTTTLRIIGGEHRGVPLVTPRGKDLLRPMRAMVREALFNSLGEAVLDVAALDLFAGSGSLGLEALSRGAARAVFVDRAAPCLAALEANVERLRVGERATVVRHDLRRGLATLRGLGPFGLVLVHPPFELLGKGKPTQELDVAALLTEVATLPGLLLPGAWIAFETPADCYREPAVELPALEVVRRREYGSTALFLAPVS